MILLLILVPMSAGILAFFLTSDRIRRALLLFAAGAHALLTGAAWFRTPVPVLNGWLLLDDLGLLFLSITSFLFLTTSFYTLGYLRREDWGRRQDFEEGFLFTNAREATFTGCLLLFLATMTLVTVSQHLGLLWVAVEATTLSSAPLICFHRHGAHWKPHGSI